MEPTTPAVRLRRDGDVLTALTADGRELAVRLAWARPISGRGGEVSVLDRQKKEVCLLRSLAELDDDSRRLALDELERRYMTPRIVRVIRATANHGVRYWHVETDRGERRFAMKNASRNAFWPADDQLMLRDALGCLYEVRPYSGLDARSRAEIEKVL